MVEEECRRKVWEGLGWWCVDAPVEGGEASPYPLVSKAVLVVVREVCVRYGDMVKESPPPVRGGLGRDMPGSKYADDPAVDGGVSSCWLLV